MNKQDYISQLNVAVSQLHNCGAKPCLSTKSLTAKRYGKGTLRFFDLYGHPKAKRAYAWSHLDGAKDECTRFVAVLEIPPVVSAETAVRVQIVKDVKGGKAK